MDKIETIKVDGPPSKDLSDQVLHYKTQAETWLRVYSQLDNQIVRIREILAQDPDRYLDDKIRKIKNVLGD